MSENRTLRVLGISGSLRKGSFNTAALRAALELAPAGVVIDEAEIGDLPLYNDDFGMACKPGGRIEEVARRGGSVCLNSFRAFAKWISALVTPPPGLASAG